MRHRAALIVRKTSENGQSRLSLRSLRFETRPFFCRQPSSFLLKNDDVLPRQARDKHNEALLTKTKMALAQNSVALAKAQMQTLADRDAKIGPYYTERWGQLPPTGERTKTPRFAMQVSHL